MKSLMDWQRTPLLSLLGVALLAACSSEPPQETSPPPTDAPEATPTESPEGESIDEGAPGDDDSGQQEPPSNASMSTGYPTRLMVRTSGGSADSGTDADVKLSFRNRKGTWSCTITAPLPANAESDCDAVKISDTIATSGPTNFGVVEFVDSANTDGLLLTWFRVYYDGDYNGTEDAYASVYSFNEEWDVGCEWCQTAADDGVTNPNHDCEACWVDSGENGGCTGVNVELGNTTNAQIWCAPGSLDAEPTPTPIPTPTPTPTATPVPAEYTSDIVALSVQVDSSSSYSGSTGDLKLLFRNTAGTFSCDLTETLTAGSTYSCDVSNLSGGGVTSWDQSYFGVRLLDGDETDGLLFSAVTLSYDSDGDGVADGTATLDTYVQPTGAACEACGAGGGGCDACWLDSDDNGGCSGLLLPLAQPSGAICLNSSPANSDAVYSHAPTRLAVRSSSAANSGTAEALVLTWRNLLGTYECTTAATLPDDGELSCDASQVSSSTASSEEDSFFKVKFDSSSDDDGVMFTAFTVYYDATGDGSEDSSMTVTSFAEGDRMSCIECETAATDPDFPANHHCDSCWLDGDQTSFCTEYKVDFVANNAGATCLGWTWYTPPYQAQAVDESMGLEEVSYLTPLVVSGPNWMNAGYRAIDLRLFDCGDWQGGSYGPSWSTSDCGDYTGSLSERLDWIVSWHESNPTEVPILFVLKLNLGDFDAFEDWTQGDIQDLDDWIASWITTSGNSDRVFTYSDLRAFLGDPSDLRTALKSTGWPAVKDLKDKILIFIADDTENTNAAIGATLDADSSTTAFICPTVNGGSYEQMLQSYGSMTAGASTAVACSYVRYGDNHELSLNTGASLKQITILEQGFVTSSEEAYPGIFNTDAYDYSKHFESVAHGASVVGVDTSYWDDPTAHAPTWSDSGILPIVARRRGLPGYFEMHTDKSDDAYCLDVAGGAYSNGTEVVQWECHGGTNQQWVYSAEFQLRPAGDTAYCLDVEGGSNAEAGSAAHIWDCDGGTSEKWMLREQGQFWNREGGEDDPLCLDLSGDAQDSGFALQACHDTARDQLFDLETLPDWTQRDEGEASANALSTDYATPLRVAVRAEEGVGSSGSSMNLELVVANYSGTWSCIFSTDLSPGVWPLEDCTMVYSGGSTSASPYLAINGYSGDTGDGLLISDVKISWESLDGDTYDMVIPTFNHYNYGTLGGESYGCTGSSNTSCDGFWLDDDDNGECTHWNLFLDGRDVEDTSTMDAGCLDSLL